MCELLSVLGRPERRADARILTPFWFLARVEQGKEDRRELEAGFAVGHARVDEIAEGLFRNGQLDIADADIFERSIILGQCAREQSALYGVSVRFVGRSSSQVDPGRALRESLDAWSASGRSSGRVGHVERALGS